MFATGKFDFHKRISLDLGIAPPEGRLEREDRIAAIRTRLLAELGVREKQDIFARPFRQASRHP